MMVYETHSHTHIELNFIYVVYCMKVFKYGIDKKKGLKHMIMDYKEIRRN